MTSTSEGSEPADLAPGQPTGLAAALWYPPLPLWKLFLLLFLSLGTYSAFYLYRTSRELRDHGETQFRPWLYVISIFFAPATGVASARLARAAAKLAGPEKRLRLCRPSLIGLLVFATSVALTFAGKLPYYWMTIPALLAFCLPWLLLQRQLNLVKGDVAAAGFRTAPNRYTKLQIAGLVTGAVVYIGIGFTLRQEFARMSGEALEANVPYTDPAGRFRFQAPRRGWTVIKGSILNSESDLELFGPGPSDWAIIYVHEQTGWTIDDLVESRFPNLMDDKSSYRELRRLIPGTELAVSLAEYRSDSPLDGPQLYTVTSFVTQERALEMIVYTAGRDLADARGLELAESFRPVIQP